MGDILDVGAIPSFKKVKGEMGNYLGACQTFCVGFRPFRRGVKNEMVLLGTRKGAERASKVLVGPFMCTGFRACVWGLSGPFKYSAHSWLLCVGVLRQA